MSIVLLTLFVVTSLVVTCVLAFGIYFATLVLTKESEFISATASTNEVLVIDIGDSFKWIAPLFSDEYYVNRTDWLVYEIPEADRKNPVKLAAFKDGYRGFWDTLLMPFGAVHIGLWNRIIGVKIHRIPIVKQRLLDQQGFDPMREDLSLIIKVDDETTVKSLRIIVQPPVLATAIPLEDGSFIDVIFAPILRLVDPRHVVYNLKGKYLPEVAEVLSGTYATIINDPGMYPEGTKTGGRPILDFKALSKKMQRPDTKDDTDTEDAGGDLPVLSTWVPNLNDALVLPRSLGSLLAKELRKKVRAGRRNIVTVSGYDINAVFISHIGPNKNSRPIVEALQRVISAEFTKMEQVELGQADIIKNEQRFATLVKFRSAGLQELLIEEIRLQMTKAQADIARGLPSGSTLVLTTPQQGFVSSLAVADTHRRPEPLSLVPNDPQDPTQRVQVRRVEDPPR